MNLGHYRRCYESTIRNARFALIEGMRVKTESTAATFTNSTMPILLRFTAYTVALFISTAALPLLVKGDIVLFKENGPIEWFQFGLLVVATAVFVRGALSMPDFRKLFFLLAAISAFAAIRELDVFLHRMIPGIGWKIGIPLILYALISAYRNRECLKQQLSHFLASRAFAIVWAGFLVAVPFGQLIGHGAFLQLVMGDDYNRDYKRVIEEILEVM
ncbi:MAG TPA: hypothetical protein VMR20_01835, partial [Verrucomicrobiae bacterium]|nr:hypothetical protein [Verrucomicrobiae bacterium]